MSDANQRTTSTAQAAETLAEPRHLGAPLADARVVVVLLHGRDHTLEVLEEGVVERAPLAGAAWVAPAAPERSWYPKSFLAPRDENEPKLATSLARLDGLVQDLINGGVPSTAIVLLGFSQGACLACEFAWRSSVSLGGVVAFTGGLIGPPGTRWPLDPPRRALPRLPILLATSGRDPFVPLWRVKETAAAFAAAGAAVELRERDTDIHAIDDEHLQAARRLLSSVAQRGAS